MQLAAGLLSPGSFGQGLGRGLAGYQATLANDADIKLKMQQIENTKNEAALRDLNARRAMAQLQEAQAWQQPSMGQQPAPAVPPTPAAMSTSAMFSPEVNAARTGLAQTPMPSTQAPAPSNLPPGIAGYKGMPLEQLRARMNAGMEPKEAPELWKMANFGQQLQPGYRQNADGTTSYFGDPTKGVTMSGGVVQPMPGAAETLGMLAGATKGGEMRATNVNTPIPLDRIDRGLPQGVSPFSSLDELLHGRQTPGAPLAAQPAGLQRMVAASASGQPATFNGQPIAAPAGFKTAADLAADKLRAEQGVHLDTDPMVRFKTDLLAGAHKSNADVLAKLQDTVRTEAELQNRNNQLYPLLDKIQTGGFAPEQRIAFANSLQTTGWLPDAVKGKFAEWVATGDPTTGKVIENQLAAAGIKTMLDTLDKEGKPNRAIFQEIQKAQESVKSGNATLKQVFDLQKQLYDWHFKQEQDMAGGMAAPDYNPMTLQSQLSAKRNESLKGTGLRYNPATGKIEKQ